MNRYDSFLRNMSDEEWENFAVEVLKHIGFEILTLPAYGVDGGRDFLVSQNEEKYIVSCKHYIDSGRHVGVNDEINISDRLAQFNVKGFIGFYSTGITSSLQNRLDDICRNKNNSYIIFNCHTINYIVQKMDTKILQSFGLYPNKYYMNVNSEDYKPLKCMVCGRDCLKDENIPRSLAGLAKLKNGKYEYAYGCKSCFIGVDLYITHLEIEQALHISQLQYWENMVDEYIQEGAIEVSEDFYKNRSEFLNLVRQRQLPQTEGTWCGID